MFVLDTNVVSEIRKIRVGRADPGVAEWAESVNATALYLSAITVLELETGVLRAERRDPAQGASLRAWLNNRVLNHFAGRVLAVDTAVALRCASLHVPDPRSERAALIAASALVHGMTVVTRNVADFAPTGRADPRSLGPETLKPGVAGARSARPRPARDRLSFRHHPGLDTHPWPPSRSGAPRP